jgi:hypothetical protein
VGDATDWLRRNEVPPFRRGCRPQSATSSAAPGLSLAGRRDGRGTGRGHPQLPRGDPDSAQYVKRPSPSQAAPAERFIDLVTLITGGLVLLALQTKIRLDKDTNSRWRLPKGSEKRRHPWHRPVRRRLHPHRQHLKGSTPCVGSRCVACGTATDPVDPVSSAPGSGVVHRSPRPDSTTAGQLSLHSAPGPALGR